MAEEFLANNKVNEKEDYRRQYFSKQLKLLSVLNKDWSDREEQEHRVILKFVPYDDKKPTRKNHLV
jgi:hypothetical protein